MDLRVKLLIIILIMASSSITLSIINSIKLQPIPIQSLEVTNGFVSYYSSIPVSFPPGLIIRVYAINGSSVYAVPAFVAIYGLTPRHVVPIAYGFGPVVDVPFKNVNWRFIANKWLAFNPSTGEYDTSLLIFITYVAFTKNESWIEAYSVPYNTAWVMNGPRSIRYIMLTAYVNLSTKSFRLTLIGRSQTDQSIINLASASSAYTEYNCLEQAAVTPKLSNEAQMYKPALYCYGFTGPIPLVWVTWSNAILNEYKRYGLNFELETTVYGEISWYAISYEDDRFTTIGISYNEAVDWGVNTGPILTNSVTNGDSAYVYYDGTLVTMNYSEYVYNIHLNAYEYVGQVPIIEVISVSTSSSGPLGADYDYGNGPISMIYNALVPLAEQYLGYPVLNQSTVVTYTGWDGPEGIEAEGCVSMSPYQEPNGYTEWIINLENVTQLYQLSEAELGYEFSALGLFLGPFDIIVDLIGLLIPPNTQTNVQQTMLTIGVPTNNLYNVSWYVSLVNASNVFFNAPALGFILNATSYYQDPNNILNCEGALTLPK